MKTNTKPLQPNCFYHIYNRGINGESLFKEERNYPYFLSKYAQYVSPYVDTYAYCLLKNHFHLLIRTHSEDGIGQLLEKDTISRKLLYKEKGYSWWLSHVFASLFKSYAQAINKAYHRTGGLFEEPFRRILVNNDAYFSAMVYYIHANPQKHGFVRDFREYPHSSYHSHLSDKKTQLARGEVIKWFGSAQSYEVFHLGEYQEQHLKHLILEFD